MRCYADPTRQRWSKPDGTLIINPPLFFSQRCCKNLRRLSAPRMRDQDEDEDEDEDYGENEDKDEG